MILIRDATDLISCQYKFDDSKELIGASSKGLGTMRDSAESKRVTAISPLSFCCQSIKVFKHLKA